VISADGWAVQVEQVIFGPSISGEVPVWTYVAGGCDGGYRDPNIEEGDTVEVYGMYYPEAMAMYPEQVRICESDDYYIVREICTDAYEPDDTYQEAKWITTDGASQTHRLCHMFEDDWVKFDATATCTYAAETFNLSNDHVYPFLSLYDTHGQTMLACGSYGEAPIFQHIDWVAPADGVYYLRVYQSDHDPQGGSYEIRVMGSCDTTLPSITNIRRSSDAINKQGCPEPTTVTIRADVTDPPPNASGLAWVRLCYTPPGSSETCIDMTRESGDTYVATIGPFSQAGTLEYYVKARDNADNGAQSSTRTLTVNDCIAPNGLDLSQLEPGDILMVNASPLVDFWVGKFGGYWGHTAIYAGDQQAVEAIGEGVTQRPIDQAGFCTSRDWVVKRVNTTELWKLVAVLFAQDQIGKPYNIELWNKWRMDAYYCSQLVWRAYCGSGDDCRIDLDGDWSVRRCYEMGYSEDHCNRWAIPSIVFPDDIYHDEEHLTEVQAREWDAQRAVLYLGSPADFYITDPHGRHVGVDPNTGEVVEEIPEVVYYSGPDAEPEYVLIMDMEGSWDVKVIGRGSGTYTLATEVVGLGERAQIDHVTKATNPGQIDDYQLTYPTTPGEPIPLIPKTVSLQPDWNLISLPLVPADTSVGTVLSSISGNYDLVYAYDGCDTADPWKKRDVNAPPYANDLTNLDEKMGIWIRVTDTSTLSVSGQVPTGSDIQLCEGWNLVGYPSTQAKSITDALSSIEGKYTLVYAYDALDTADPWKKYDVTAPPYANDLTEMQPGLAYWIKVSEDCVLTVSN